MIPLRASGVFQSDNPYNLGILELVISLLLYLKMTNHSINFVLYCLSSRVFRKELILMAREACCVICRNKP